MKKLLIDLSREISNVAGEPDEVSVEVLSHEEGAKVLGEKFGLTQYDFPDNMAINNERISLTTHTGTHMDSPYHYGPSSEGKIAKRISDIPLEWCVNKGIMVDLSDSNSQKPVTKEEIKNYLEKYKIKLVPLTIILINTGADLKWGKPEYFTDFRGISQEALKYLLNFGVKVIGVDSFGFDPPFNRMLKDYTESKDNSFLWPSHIFGRTKEYCQIERLTNLDLLPKGDFFDVFCAPIKIRNLGAGWCRVVAIV